MAEIESRKIYIDAEFLEFLRTSIENTSDGVIRCKIEDIKKEIEIGKNESSTSIYWGLKYALFAEGFVVTAGETLIGEPVLVMRKKAEDDILPLKNLIINNDSKVLISMSIDGEYIFQELGLTKDHAISLLEEIGYGTIGNEKYKIDEVPIFW